LSLLLFIERDKFILKDICIFQIIQQRRRKFSKATREVDFSGFEATEDVQEQNMNVEDEEIEQLSDLDSGDESGYF